MERDTKLLPAVSLVVSGVSALAFVAVGLFATDVVRSFLIVASIGGLIGASLGVYAVFRNRREDVSCWMPGVLAVFVGVGAFLWYGLGAWLMTPF